MNNEEVFLACQDRLCLRLNVYQEVFGFDPITLVTVLLPILVEIFKQCNQEEDVSEAQVVKKLQNRRAFGPLLVGITRAFRELGVRARWSGRVQVADAISDFFAGEDEVVLQGAVAFALENPE